MSAPGVLSAPPAARVPRVVSRPRRISRTAHLMIAREVLKSFLLVMLVFETVLGCVFSFGAVRDYGVDLALLLPFLGPALAAYLDAAIPVSLLFSTALAYGRLIADREVAALKSFGFSYLELLLAPAALGVLLGGLVLVLNLFVVPELRFTRDNLGFIILERLRSLGEGSNQSFDLGKRNTLWVESFRGSELRGIFIAGETGDSLGLRGLGEGEGKEPVQALSYPVIVYAREGRVVSGPGGQVTLEIHDVTSFVDAEVLPSQPPPELRDFKQSQHLSRYPYDLIAEKARRNNKELGFGDLREKITRLEREIAEINRQNPGSDGLGALIQIQQHRAAVTECHRRLAMALAAVGFPLLAALLALFLNSPNRLLPLFVSLMTGPAVFYVLEMYGNSWARSGHLPWLWEELGNLGLGVLIAGLFLALRRRTLW